MPLPPTPYPVAHIEFEGQSVLSSDIRSLDLLTNVSWQADQLTLVLDNARLLSDFIRKEQGVECWLGYAADPYLWDKSELTHVFSGAVDGVLPSFGQDTTLTVMCRDHTRELIDSQADPGWSYMSLADAGIVTLLAERAGLTPKVSPSMVPISEQEQRSFLGGGYPGNPEVGASGWDIVQELAIRNGFVAYVTVDKVLYWGPRNDHPASIGTWTYLEEPFDLLAANFEDSVLVINKVTVVRWLGLDQVQPDGFVSGFAVDAGRIAAMRGRINEKTVASTTAASVQDCEAEAAALLKTLARPAIICTATVEGDPRLIGDAKLTLAGRVGRFKGDYYIEGAKHHFGTDGYTCALELTSVRPEASEAYRSALNVGQGQDQALAPDVPGVASTVPTCGSGPPVDLVPDEWQEFGPSGPSSAPVARFLEASGVSALVSEAVCGPIAAAGMLRAYGISTDPGKLTKRAMQGDSGGAWWTSGDGMAGPDSEVKLIESQGLQATKLGAGGQAEAIKRCSACQPVIFDTPKHYLLAQAYRADGRFFVGNTGSNALNGGSDWMSLAEIAANPGTKGAVRAYIVADVPLPSAARAADVTNLPPLQVDGRSHQAFVDSSKPLAYAWEKQTGIPAVVFMAISASESNWGGAAKPPTVMLFGIGADGVHPSVTFSDNPYMAFRAYPDANGAYADFVGLVTQGRYATAYARVKAGGSGEQFVADLQSAGYAGHHNASDEDWTNIITSLMRQVEALL